MFCINTFSYVDSLCSGILPVNYNFFLLPSCFLDWKFPNYEYKYMVKKIAGFFENQEEVPIAHSHKIKFPKELSYVNYNGEIVHLYLTRYIKMATHRHAIYIFLLNNIALNIAHEIKVPKYLSQLRKMLCILPIRMTP
jgi:hypothetical protein